MATFDLHMNVTEIVNFNRFIGRNFALYDNITFFCTFNPPRTSFLPLLKQIVYFMHYFIPNTSFLSVDFFGRICIFRIERESIIIINAFFQSSYILVHFKLCYPTYLPFAITCLFNVLIATISPFLENFIPKMRLL